MDTGTCWSGYVDQVVISSGAEVMHPRSYEQDDFVFDPIHYLPLLERKTAALDQAAPLQGWDLPEEYQTLRRLLEARMGKRGKREFVQVLRCAIRRCTPSGWAPMTPSAAVPHRRQTTSPR